jgi:lysozyme
MRLRQDVEDLLILAAVAGGLWILWRTLEEANATEAAGALAPNSQPYALPAQGAPAASTDAQAEAPLPQGEGLPFPAQAPPQNLSSDILNAVIPQQLSPAGEAFIKKQEGLTLSPKPEPNGGRFIGYGHYIAPGDTWGGTITQEQAEELFQHDAGDAEDLVRTNVKVALSQNQFDALTDLAFNIPAAFAPTTGLMVALNTGNYQKAAAEILRWNKEHRAGQVVASTGLTKRRQAEQQLFNQPAARAAGA